MKLIKNILIAFCVCCVSCGNSSATSVRDDVVTKEQVSDMIKEAIDDVKNEMTKMNSVINQQKDLLQKTKGNTNKWIVFSWLALLTGIIIWLIYCWNKTAEDKELKALQQDIQNIKNRLYTIKEQIQSVNKKNENSDNIKILQQIQYLSNRLSKLENKQQEIDIPKRNSVEVPQFSNPFKKNKEDNHIKKGYFGNVKGDGIFNDIFYSMQEEAKFIVWFSENNEEAEFDIIELSRICSFDGIEKAIDYAGDELTLQNASSSITIEKGIVKKNSEDIWKIIRKVKIELK